MPSENLQTLMFSKHSTSPPPFPVSRSDVLSIRRMPGAIRLLIRCRLLLVMLLFTLCAATVQAVPGDVPLGERVDLGPHLFYLEDAAGTKSLDDVKSDSDHWQRLNAPSVNLGFVHSAYWFHVAVVKRRAEAQQLVLEQRYALMDDMQVYWQCDEGSSADFIAGDLLPWAARPLKHHGFLFPLQAAAGERCDLWVRAKNTEAMELPLILWEKDVYHEQARNTHLIDGIFLGFFAIMALYNLLLYVNVRDLSYFYYTLFVVSMFVFFASQQGYLYEWLMGESPRIHHYLIPFNLAIIVIFGSMFFLHFLGLRTLAPRLGKVIEYLVLVLVATPFTAFWLDYATSVGATILLISLGAILGLSGAVYLSFQNVRSAQILLSGWFVLVVCVVFQTLSKLGALHNDFIADYGLRTGTALEIVIFSLALSYRINEERKAKEAALVAAQHERLEKLQAQGLALEKEREAREIKEHALEQQRRVNEQLEYMVHERTHELEDALNELERTNRELQALSVKDALTNVFNRRFFNQKIAEEWMRASRHGRAFALLMVDIDKFKVINDTHGHVCGDHVLAKVAAVLKNVVCRPGDTISRYGGEEFAVLLPDTGNPGAEKVAEVLVQRVAQEKILFNEATIPVTISIGLAVCRIGELDTELQSFIERADKALYHAKEGGRNRYVVSLDA